MELVFLDEEMSIVGRCAKFNELNWIRRYESLGEYQTTIPLTDGEISMEELQSARYVYHTGNGGTALVGKISRQMGERGAFCQISGYMLEGLLESRIVTDYQIGNYTVDYAARAMVTQYAVTTPRTIPGLSVGVYAGTTPTVYLSIDAGTVLSQALYSLTAPAGLSWRLTRRTDSTRITFAVWSGQDRSDGEGMMVFSSRDGSGMAAKYDTIPQRQYNYAYVDVGWLYAVDCTGDGEPRREMYVPGPGGEYTGSASDFQAAIRQYGINAMRKAADAGGVTVYVPEGREGAICGQDFDLGDLCRLDFPRLGIRSVMRLTQINEQTRNGKTRLECLFRQPN